MTKIKLLLLLLFPLFFNACIEPQESFSKIPSGTWRGVLYLQDNPVVVTDKDEITYGQDATGHLPFTFDVVYDNDTTFHIVIHNASEEIVVKDITFGRTKELAKDTVGIHFKVYDTYISALYEDRLLEGYWHVNYKENYRIRFRAEHGDNRRFKLPVDQKAVSNFDGKWQLIFGQGTEEEYPGVGHFIQDGKKITGTVETETGDFRYMEGSVNGDKAYLSCFDGAHAFLIESKLLEGENYSGIFYSGNASVESITGVRNENANLANAYDLSKSISNESVHLKSIDSDGKSFDLDDPNLSTKNKVIMLMGTWCPNCKDATTFLKEFSKSEEGKEVVIASVAFERYRDSSRVAEQIRTYKSRSEIPWPVMFGGYYNKKEATQNFQLLDDIKAYPTLLILDKRNQIKHVFTGFYGPATDKYESFKTDFYGKIAALSNE